ncbi:MAG: B12-binding domain-containing radical SAM protein, partial [Thermodesulfobacteriota bacterium]
KGIDGVEISYNFFKNPPGQTLQGFLALMLFCIRTKRALGKRVHFEFNSIRVEPHTALHNIALEEGFVTKGQDLLEPVYYTNPGTRYIERIFNVLLRLKGK